MKNGAGSDTVERGHGFDVIIFPGSEASQLNNGLYRLSIFFLGFLC